MPRDYTNHLSDILEAARDIQRFTAGFTFEQYERDTLVKAAVERKFTIIGEALVRLRQDRPDLLDRIRDTRRIIGFRNIVVHGYDVIRDRPIWSIIHDHLPLLIEDANALLKS